MVLLLLGGYGLGFDPVSNDYKVVVCDTSLDKVCYAFAYSSNSDTQGRLVIFDYFLPTNKEITSPGQTVIVNDCPYWTLIFKNWSDEFLTVIALKFETQSNEFKMLPKFKLFDEYFQSKRVKNIRI